MYDSPTKNGYIQLNAMFFLLQDTEKEKVAKASLIDLRTLNRWIKLYNESGIDGLIYEKRPGRLPIIHNKEAKDIISYPENPQKADRDHWTLIGLHGYLKEEIDLKCSYSTLVRKVPINSNLPFISELFHPI